MLTRLLFAERAQPGHLLPLLPQPRPSLEMEDRLGPGLYPHQHQHQHQHQLHPGDSRAPAHPRSSGAETFSASDA